MKPLNELRQSFDTKVNIRTDAPSIGQRRDKTIKDNAENLGSLTDTLGSYINSKITREPFDNSGLIAKRQRDEDTFGSITPLDIASDVATFAIPAGMAEGAVGRLGSGLLNNAIKYTAGDVAGTAGNMLANNQLINDKGNVNTNELGVQSVLNIPFDAGMHIAMNPIKTGSKLLNIGTKAKSSVLNIKDTAKDKINNFTDYIKDPTGDANFIRVHNDNLKDFNVNKEDLKGTKNYKDFDVIDPQKVSNRKIRQKLNSGEILPISEFLNDNADAEAFNSNVKDGTYVMNGGSLAEGRGGLVLSKDLKNRTTDAFKKQLMEKMNLSEDKANDIIKNNNIILVDLSKRKTYKDIALTLEHELSHLKNYNITGDENKIFDNVNKHIDTFANIISKTNKDFGDYLRKDKKYIQYLFNESEAAAKIGSLVEKIKKGRKLTDTDETDISVYANLAGVKNWMHDLETENQLVDVLNKAHDIIDNVYHNGTKKEANKGFSDINTDNIHISEIKRKVKELKAKGYEDIDLDFISREPSEHIKILKTLDEQNKADYLDRLYKMLGYSNDETTTRLMNDLEKIEKGLDKTLLNKIEEKKLELRKNGVKEELVGTKAIQEVIKDKRLSPRDRSLVKSYSDTIKLLKENNEEKTKLLREIFKKDKDGSYKYFNELQTDAINNEIEKHNNKVMENNGEVTPEGNIDFSKKTTDNLVEPIKKRSIINKRGSKDLLDRPEEHDIPDTVKEEKVVKEVKKQENSEKKTTENKTENKIENKTKNKTDKETKKEAKNKTEPKKEEEPKKKQSNIDIGYAKTKIKTFGLKLKSVKKRLFTPNVKKIYRILLKDGYNELAYSYSKATKIFMSEFTEKTGKNIGFEEQSLALVHEYLHLLVEKNKILKDIINKVEPSDEIRKLYEDLKPNEKDKDYDIKIKKYEQLLKEEEFVNYVARKFIKDLFENSNYGKIVDKSIIREPKPNKIIDDIYKERILPTLIYEVRNRKTLLNRFFDTSTEDYIIGSVNDIDKTVSDFIKDTAKKIFPEKVFKDFIGRYNTLKEIYHDINIGNNTKDKIYENIRKAFSYKHSLLSQIKNTSNMIPKVLTNSELYKKLGDEKFNKVIEKLAIVDTLFSDNFNFKTIKDFYDNTSMIKVEDIVSNKKYIKLVKNIIDNSYGEPKNSKFYMKNADIIYAYLKKHNMLAKNIDKSYIEILLDRKLVEENKDLLYDLDFDEDVHNVMSLIKKQELKTLGSDRIRGYKSFVPKNNVITIINTKATVDTIIKDGIEYKRFKKTPFFYATDIRNGVENNLFEYRQDGTTGLIIPVKDIKLLSKEANEIKKKFGIEPSYEIDSNGNVIGLRIHFEKDFDKFVGDEQNKIKSLSSRISSLLLNDANQKVAKMVSEDLKGIFKTKDPGNGKFVKLSNEEIKIFRDIGLNIQFVRKDFKNLLAGQKEFLFSNINNKTLRIAEKTYKQLVKKFKANVTVYNVKSIVNNFMVVPSILVQNGVKPSRIFRTVSKTLKDYNEYFNSISSLKEKIVKLKLHGDSEGLKKSIDRDLGILKRNNVFAHMQENGIIQTIADDYLMKNNKNKTTIGSELDMFFKEKNINIEPNSDITDKIMKFFEYLETKSINGMNMADLVGRGSLYRESLAQGKSVKEASRITNEAFVDFRRVYPKLINELDNYGLPFIGFMYRNSVTLAKAMVDRPVTSVAIFASLLLLHNEFGDDDRIGHLRTKSWEYQNSFIDNRFLDGSILAKLFNGDVPSQMFLPNNALIAERVAKGTESPAALFGLTIY